MCNCDPCRKGKNSGGSRGPQGFEGARGSTGRTGPPGIQGPIGPAGTVSIIDLAGLTTGPAGPIGPIGLTGAAGTAGLPGTPGPIGLTGPVGTVGARGPAGPSFSIARFFGMSPSDYPSTVAIGTALGFPQNGVVVGTDVVRITASEFNLVSIGVYTIEWQTSVNEPGQLTLWGGLGTGTSPVSGGRFADSTVGRATGTSQIIGKMLVKTTFPNTHIGVYNDSSASALTVTPLAGGTEPVSSWLLIQRVS